MHGLWLIIVNHSLPQYINELSPPQAAFGSAECLENMK